MEDFTFDILETLNSSAKTKCTANVDILTDAPLSFIKEVGELEKTLDPVERSKEAIRYITECHYQTFVNYQDLINYLTNPDICSKSTWRQLYLLERSIPKRKDTPQISWFDRLKIFADTYKLEHAVVGKSLRGLPGKIFFTRKSCDHEKLRMGPGSYAADFYCWDAANNKFHDFVEFKHWATTDLQKAVEFYKTKRYDARYVLLLLKDCYYLIDYKDINSPIITKQLALKVPKLLYW